MLLRKPVLVATLATVVAAAGLSTRANAADPLLGALIGGGIGAAIGHDVNGRHGTAAGAAIGAVLGSAIASDANRSYYGDRYYEGGYYAAPAPVYYGPSYYAPAPAYYGPSVVVGASYPVYRSRYYGYRQWDGHRHWR